MERIPAARIAIAAVAVLLVASGILLRVTTLRTVREKEVSPLRPGLVAIYSDSRNRIVCLEPAAPQFVLGARQSIHPALTPGFSARWEGVLQIDRGGTYQISGPARVFVSGREVQNKPIRIDSGEHSIRIDYLRGEGTARFHLQWESNFFKREPLPAQVLGHRERSPEVEQWNRVERGRDMAEEFNCVACHSSRVVRLQGRGAPDLSAIGSRARHAWLVHWLENPARFRPEAMVPCRVPGEDRLHIGAYLATLKERGDEVGETPPSKSGGERGKLLFDTLGCTACHGQGGVSLVGLGSKMDAADLEEYLIDPLRIDPSGRMPSMLLSREEARALSEHLVQSRNLEFESPPAGGEPARGKRLVAEKRCGACHTMGPDKVPPQESGARLLESLDLDSTRACLSPQPSGDLPHYGLTEEQRKDIEAFLKSLRRSPDISEAPVHSFQRTLRRFRCAACHAGTNSKPGQLSEWAPPLDELKDRLRVSWLDQVLIHKKRVRSWLDLRMPHYGEQNVGSLVSDFAAFAPEEESTASQKPQTVQEGLKLVGKGEGGFSCIDCHDFKGRPAPRGGTGGTDREFRGPDLVEIAGRLRPPFFRRWMRDPARFRPGTPMPNFYDALPESTAEETLDSLWSCLSLGQDMPPPVGLEEAKTHVVYVGSEPVVLRAFLPDSSTRSIAVGFPGHQSYCFDAQECRVRYAWSGSFLDLSLQLTGRGGGMARPLGLRYWQAPDSFPLRIADPHREPKRRFRGYRLGPDGPEFVYELDTITVRQRIKPHPGGRGIVQSFELAPVNEHVWFLPGRMEGVSVTSSEGLWEGERLRFSGGPTLRFNVSLKVTEKR